MANNKVLIMNGMSQVQDADLNGPMIAFINLSPGVTNGVTSAPTGGGVVGQNDYTVLQNGATPSNPTSGSPNMTVNIWPGRAWIPNLTSPVTNVYGAWLDTTQTLTIGASGSLPRIDYVVLYINLNAPSIGTGQNIPSYADVQGTPASVPVAPTTTQITNTIGVNCPYIILGQINIGAGAGSINSTMITSLRYFCFLTTGQTVGVPAYINFTDQGTAPSNPSTGHTELFTFNSNLYLRQPTGNAVQIGSSSLPNLGNAAATQQVDWQANGISQAFTITTTTNSPTTLTNFTFVNPVVGEKLILQLTQGASGGPFTINFTNANIIWPQNVAPTLTTTASNTDILGFVYDGTYYRGAYSLGYPH